MSTPQPLPPPSPPYLDPPFRGYIETTYDALLVFEAARRGMIPRVTRRLIERERGMVQSGAVFVFDEQESGIKRWTDGLVWSPSRILGNFLVYRETDKRPNPSSTPGLSGSSSQNSPSGTPSRNMAPPGQYGESSQMGMMQSHSTGEIPILVQGAIRPRSTSEGGMDRQKERQLVGSLTNSYKFRDGGLVKKTMSVNIGNYSQHMVSYYTIEDVMAGKFRTPSTIPELAALEISVDYLQKQNFRFPPLVEMGQDGILRYRGEGEEPLSPNTPMSGLSLHSYPSSDPYDAYGQVSMHPHGRGMSHPSHIPMPLPVPHGYPHPSSHSLSPGSYATPGSSGSHYFDPVYSGPSSAPAAQPIPIQRQVSAGGGPHRPTSSRTRYDPYGQSASPRVLSLGVSPGYPGPGSASSVPSGPSSNSTSMGRRQSVPHHPASQQIPEYYEYPDVKPIINPTTGAASYAYQPPATAPGSFAEYYPNASTPTTAAMASPVVSYTPVPSTPVTYGPSSSSSASTHPQLQPHPQQHQYTSNTGWQTGPAPAVPLPGSQSRLVPAQPREYDYDYSKRPSSSMHPPPSAGLGAGLSTGVRPPSSSGSSGSTNPPLSAGLPRSVPTPGPGHNQGQGEFAFVPPHPHSGASTGLGGNPGGGGARGDWIQTNNPDTNAHLNMSSSPIPAMTPIPAGPSGAGIGPGAGGLSSPAPGQLAMASGAGGQGGMGGLDMGQYIVSEEWGGS